MGTEPEILARKERKKEMVAEARTEIEGGVFVFLRCEKHTCLNADKEKCCFKMKEARPRGLVIEKDPERQEGQRLGLMP